MQYRRDTIIAYNFAIFLAYRFNSQTYTFNSSARTRASEAGRGDQAVEGGGRGGGGGERKEFKQSTTHGREHTPKKTAPARKSYHSRARAHTREARMRDVLIRVYIYIYILSMTCRARIASE